MSKQIDQESMLEGICLGLRTALFVVTERGITGLEQYSADWDSRLLQLVMGKSNGRPMVADDILLKMPMATAADFGLAA